MKKLFVATAAACLLLASLAGCTAETPLLPSEAENDDDLCTFTLSAGSNVSVETRALADTKIDEVWVVQISEDGMEALTAPQHLTPDASNKIRAKLEKVESKIYFIANTGNNTLFNPDADLSTINNASIEGAEVVHTANGGDWGQRTNIPMYGTWIGTPKVPVIADSPNDKVELARALAHIKVTLSATGSIASNFYVTSIQLKNVPTKTPMVPTFAPSAIYPATNTTTFGNYPAIEFTPPKLISTAHTCDFYMPENCRGTGPERYETEKNGTLLSGGEQYATYLEVKGTLGQNTSTRLAYRFFLGANNTNDYNVRRGYIYTVKIVISGMNPADTRMTIDGTSTIHGGATIDKDWGSTSDIGSVDCGNNWQ